MYTVCMTTYRASITDLRANLGPLIEKVQWAGATVQVTKRGRIVALLVPVPREDETPQTSR